MVSISSDGSGLLKRYGLDILRERYPDKQLVSIYREYICKEFTYIFCNADVLFENADFSDVRMIVLPGGQPGANNLMKHEGLETYTVLPKPVNLWQLFACPDNIGTVGLLKGLNATVYPGYDSLMSGPHYCGL